MVWKKLAVSERVGTGSEVAAPIWKDSLSMMKNEELGGQWRSLLVEEEKERELFSADVDNLVTKIRYLDKLMLVNFDGTYADFFL